MRIERFGADGDPRWVRACHGIHVAVGAADDCITWSSTAALGAADGQS